MMMMMIIIIDVTSIAPYLPVNGEHTALYKTKTNANRKPNNYIKQQNTKIPLSMNDDIRDFV